MRVVVVLHLSLSLLGRALGGLFYFEVPFVELLGGRSEALFHGLLVPRAVLPSLLVVLLYDGVDTGAGLAHLHGDGSVGVEHGSDLGIGGGVLRAKEPGYHPLGERAVLLAVGPSQSQRPASKVKVPTVLSYQSPLELFQSAYLSAQRIHRLSQSLRLFIESDDQGPPLLPERGQLPGKVSSFRVEHQLLADAVVVEL